MTGGPYAQVTGHDHLPLDGFGGAAGAGGAATDHSADVNVNGGNDVAANAEAEAREIAAVPDPQSPAGQAAILAIIQKYQGRSAGTVEGASATEQANGTQAAGNSGDGDRHRHGDGDGDDGDSRGGSGLLDILSQLLGSGGSGLQGMNPFGQGMSPFGQGMSSGANPFGDPYGAQQVGATSPASNPFADPLPSPSGAPATTVSATSDPFASSPAGGTGATPAGNPNAASNPFTTAGNTTGGQGAGGTGAVAPGAAGSTNKGGAAASTTSGVDLDAFSGGDGAAVPADPAITATGSK